MLFFHGFTFCLAAVLDGMPECSSLLHFCYRAQSRLYVQHADRVTRVTTCHIYQARRQYRSGCLLQQNCTCTLAIFRKTPYAIGTQQAISTGQ